MRSYFSHHPELVSILALFAAVLLLGGLTFDYSQSQAAPTPAIPPGFRGIEPPLEGSSGNTRGPARVAASTENDLGLLHSDNFDGSDTFLSAWLSEAGWSLVPSKRGQALQIPNRGQRVEFILDSLKDVVVKTRLKLNTRGAEIRLRESDSGFYAVRLFARGQVQLLRNTDVLADVAIPKIKRGKWTNVRVSFIEDKVSIKINGTEIIAVQETSPLPAGKFSIIKLGASKDPLLLEDMKIWLPRSDVPWLRTEAEWDELAGAAGQPRSTVDVTNTAELIVALENAPQPVAGVCPSGTAVINLSTDGLYVLTQRYGSGSTSADYNGLPHIRCNVVIEGNGATIRRDSAERFRILHVSGGWLTLNNITIEGGDARDTSQPAYNGGGGIFVSLGRADLNNVIVTENLISQGTRTQGAGIHSSWSVLNVTDSIISNNDNYATNGSGAGISILTGTTSISNTIVEGNSAADGGGGGIDIGTGGQVTISNNTRVIDNMSDRAGGGISISGAHTVAISETTISGNHSSGAGGVYNNFINASSPGTTITSSIVSNNSSWAIYSVSKLSINNSCIQENPSFGIMNISTTGTIDATGNWWGASNGPSGVGPGNGDSVSANVDYSNWLTNTPSICSPLHLDLDLDWDKLTPDQLSDPYSFAIGETIPLLAEVSPVSGENVTDPVQMELTVPRGLKPTGMTITGEDSNALVDLILELIGLLGQINPDWNELLNDIVGIFGDEQAVTFVYDIDQGLVIGQPFEITLEVVGEVAGEFSIEGSVQLQPAEVLNNSNNDSMSSVAHSRFGSTTSRMLSILILPEAINGLSITTTVSDNLPEVDSSVTYSVNLTNTTAIAFDQPCILPETVDDEVTEESCLRLSDFVPEGVTITSLVIDSVAQTVVLDTPIDIIADGVTTHRVWIRTPEDDAATSDVIEGGYTIDWFVARELSAAPEPDATTLLELGVSIHTDYVGVMLTNQVTADLMPPTEASILPVGCNVAVTERILLGNNPSGSNEPGTFVVDSGAILGITGQLLPAFNPNSDITWYRVVGFSSSNPLQQAWVRDQDLDEPNNCLTKIPLLHSADGGNYNIILAPSQLVSLQAVENAVCFGALRNGEVPNDGKVLSLAQITELTNIDPTDAGIAGLTPKYPFDFSKPSIVAVEKFHLNRQYIRISYFDDNGTLIDDGDSWVRVRTQLSGIANQISIFGLGGKDCRDSNGNFTVEKLEEMLMPESDLPTCTANQLFNCKPQAVCNSILGCSGQTPLVLNTFNDKRDGASEKSAQGACKAWSGLVGYNDGHCGLDIVASDDAVSGTVSRRAVYTIAGGIFSGYTGTNDGTYDINTRVNDSGAIRIRESNYTHIEPHPVFGNPDDITRERIGQFQGEYIAQGVELGVYGDYGLVGFGALHVHFVDKYLNDNAGALSPLGGTISNTADGYRVDAITNIVNRDIRFLPLTYLGSQQFAAGEIFGTDVNQRQLIADDSNLPEFRDDLTNPNRVNVTKDGILAMQPVNLARLRRRVEGDNFTYQFEIQGAGNTGISVTSEGNIVGTLTALPGSYTIIITITRDIDGHTEVGIRHLPLTIR